MRMRENDMREAGRVGAHRGWTVSLAAAPMFRRAAVVLGTLSCLLSCPNPLTEVQLRHVKDSVDPQIVIIYPEDDSYYASTVVVSGTAMDLSTAEGSPGAIRSLTYEVVPATIQGGTIELDAEGSFTFRFSTSGFTGPMLIKIRAVDWNMNAAEYVLNLRAADNDIPSFHGVPGNRSVTLDWDDVPLSKSYTLYYTTNGAVPSQSYGERIDDVTSPLTLTHLVNGRLHRFLLLSHSSAGDDNWSGIVDAIPLSPYSLAPVVSGGYGYIRLDWDLPSAAANTELRFDLFRSTDPRTGYVNRGTFLSNSFTDSDVANDTDYYYRVTLQASSNIESVANSGRTSIFPPNKAHLAGHCDTSWAYGIAVDDTYAYVGDYLYGFKVVDVSDPENAFVVGSCGARAARGVALKGQYAYLADGPGGLKVIDVSIPSQPRVVATCPTIEAMEVAVQGNTLYMADWNAGLVVIDISNPLSPFVTDYYVTYTAKSVAVAGDYAFIGDDAGGLKIFSVRDPRDLKLVGSCHTNQSGTTSSAWGVAVQGDFAYVCDWYEGLKVVDIADKADPVVVGRCDTSYARGVTLAGNYAYVADSWGGLRIVNVSDPLTPVLWGGYPTFNACTTSVRGKLVYVADAEQGVEIVEFSSPDFPATHGSCGTSDARSVAVVGGYAYVADYGGGLRVIDVSRPDAPRIVGTCPTYQAQGVTIAGHIALVADSNEGIKVISVEDPAAPSVIGSVKTVFASQVAVLGDHAYVADFVSGVKVIDISIPESPALVGGCATYQARSVAVAGNYAYVADYLEGFKTIDVSSPSNPFVAAKLTSGLSACFGVAVSGDYAYVADDTGLKVVNISDPKSPSLVSVDPYSGALYGVEVNGNYLYAVGNAEGPRNNPGVFIFDISDPRKPFLVGRWDAGAVFTRDIAISSRYAFVADGTGGLKALNLLAGQE